MPEIKTKEQHKAALAVVDMLMDGDPEIGSPQGEALNFIVDMVVKYETEKFGTSRKS